MMTVELFERLRKYEQYFVMAIFTDSIMAMTNSDVNELISIASEFGIVYQNNHCPKCLLEFCKRLGKIYLDNVNEYGNIRNLSKEEVQGEENPKAHNKRSKKHNPSQRGS